MKFAKLHYVSSGFLAGSLQGHWWGFISQNYVVWPIFFLMNVFIALKGTHFLLLFTWLQTPEERFSPGMVHILNDSKFQTHWKVEVVKQLNSYDPSNYIPVYHFPFLMIYVLWSFKIIHTYRKFHNYSDTPKNCCNRSKIWTMWLYHRVMSPNDADGMASSVDPEQSDLGLHCLPRHIYQKT